MLIFFKGPLPLLIMQKKNDFSQLCFEKRNELFLIKFFIFKKMNMNIIEEFFTQKFLDKMAAGQS